MGGILLYIDRSLLALANSELNWGVSRAARAGGQSLEVSADEDKQGASCSRPLREVDRVGFNHKMDSGRYKWDFFVWF